MFDKILVGTDGFGPAAKAVEKASGLAAAHGAELLAVYAYAPGSAESSPLGPREPKSGTEAGRGVLKDVEKHYGDRVRLRTIMRAGEPADVILTIADEENVDLIVVGNKGMSKRIPLGVVPNQISHHATCDVLIVRTVD